MRVLKLNSQIQIKFDKISKNYENEEIFKIYI